MFATSSFCSKFIISCGLILFISTFTFTNCQEFVCCSHTTGSCKNVCEKISLVDIAANSELRNRTIQDVRRFCSSQLIILFLDISKGESWPGRACCPLPQSESCKKSCITATKIEDLNYGCRGSDEIAFFNCLERQEEGEKCCGQSDNENCRKACFDIFKSFDSSPSKAQRTAVAEHCESTKNFDCVKDLTKVTLVTNLHKYIKCCESTNKIKCRDICKKTLSLKSGNVQDVITVLEKEGCGQPSFSDSFWGCFLSDHNISPKSVGVSTIERVGIDSAKWHCCQKAVSNQCKVLCSKTFTKDWMVLWNDFQVKCLRQLSEENLRTCIDEVDEPCELGCDGLSFCTNFNNRPTELFRSCTSMADESARYDVLHWQAQKEITLPGVPGLTLPLKNISKCSPKTWKAVACALQIRPCTRLSHGNQICRESCLEILSQCVDWEQVSTEFSAETVCSTLSPEDPNVSCISLENYFYPSENNYLEGQISSPCKNGPCGPNEICSINKNYIPRKNLPYVCSPGCKLGEVSEYMVPEGTYVRLPFPTNPKGCLKICKCTANGIQECFPLPCVALSPCWMGQIQEKPHGSNFAIECNTCSCYVTEVICSKKQCETTMLTGRNTAYTTLPCNCPLHYVPVCGSNGNIYPSACLAKCAELKDSDIEYETCPDPCRGNPCRTGEKCVPDNKVCLTLMVKPCKQYQCINGTTRCEKLRFDPVCDINNQQHDNICHLAHSNKKFAYNGPCLQNCNYKGTVCAINGRTYISECAAHADFASVDYPGPCLAVGTITDKKQKQCTHPDIECKQLSDPNCLGFTPPGACCPICGGAIRLLYSRKQIDRALYGLQGENDIYPLTLKALLQALERQVQVAQCALRGYLTVEMDIFVIIETTVLKPSELQMETCVREAEKLVNLVNTRSPRLVSELSLSSLVLATPVHTQNNFGIKNDLNGSIILIFILFWFLI
nr:reversion-inducing cysteine-rich protein with Kazal motifs [Onthophagus taurus]